MDEYERTCLCALNCIFGYAPRKGAALYAYAGSAAAVFGMDPATLRQCAGDRAADIGPAALDRARSELETVGRAGARFLTIAEPGYPALLRECGDPPLGLYLRSASPPEDLFADRPAVAVIGTRKITPYGRDWGRRIVRALAAARTQPVLVSGLAFGTDILAHREALEAGMPTVAVMATGIDRVYPWQHREDAARMARTDGCALLTDYPVGTAPIACNFLRRNRIIAGLCNAVILIESQTRGGGMLTARYAGDYDRDLYALPGRVDDPASQGCNLLIRSQRAIPVTDADDLVEQIGLGRRAAPHHPDLREEALRAFGSRLGAEEAARLGDLLHYIRAHRGITLDGLCAATGRPYAEVSGDAVLLETEGFLSIDLLQRCTVHAKFA